MPYFSDAPRFEQLPDGTYYARAGVQTNCGGIAGIHVRISPAPAGQLELSVSAHDGEHDDGFGFAVPGAAVPPVFRNAILQGAREAFEREGPQLGASLELIDALVHMIDARESKFWLAGYTAMESWLRRQAESDDPSPAPAEPGR